MPPTDVCRPVWFAILCVAILGAFATAAAAASGRSGETGKKIYRVEGDVTSPVRIAGEAPKYPEEARKERIEGRVVVRTVIGTEGDIEATEVLEAPSDELGRAAEAAVSAWKFEPATLDGEPVAVFYHLTVNFVLTPDGEPRDDGP